MPEGKKPAEDLYSAKTHLHQPVPEVSTVNATALPADAPEGALPSEVRPEIVTWEKLCEAIKASGKAYNMEMITKAYDLANKAHNGVCRRSGEPYICHPLAVARLVLDLGMDSESIAAALLHDVVEDTPTTLEDLTAAFGEEVALLVDGVTKLTKIQFSNIEELQAENLRKMLLAMSRDVRVMIDVYKRQDLHRRGDPQGGAHRFCHAGHRPAPVSYTHLSLRWGAMLSSAR